MRGRIIHYNGSDGHGLVSVEGKQHAFVISMWRSEVAPAVNQTVHLTFNGDTLSCVERVSEETLLKEKAGKLAGRIGVAGESALSSIRQNAPDHVTDWRGWVGIAGKPLLLAYGAFLISCMMFSYISISVPFGPAQSFSLIGLSDISRQLGASVGGSFWVWVAALSIILPLVWRVRWSWFALLLPLVAILKPIAEILSGVSQAARSMGLNPGSRASAQLVEALIERIDLGMGFWIGLIAAIFIAVVGVKRAILGVKQ